MVGIHPKISDPSPFLVGFAAARMSLFVAAMILLIVSLVSFVVGKPLAPRFFQALISVVMLTAFSGVVGGAVINSALVFEHFRPKKT